jgi:DNA-binding Lrp family transcriptional regulator
LSAPQCFRRVRSLEERGVIRSYRAEVQPESLGLGVMAYVSLNIDGGQFGRVREIEASIRGFPQILECHTVSGDYDYLLKVVARDLKSLSQFLTDRLMQVPGVDDVRSMICMEEVKASGKRASLRDMTDALTTGILNSATSKPRTIVRKER